MLCFIVGFYFSQSPILPARYKQWGLSCRSPPPHTYMNKVQVQQNEGNRSGIVLEMAGG